MTASNPSQLFTTSSGVRWEYDSRNTSFVKIDATAAKLNDFLCVLGGSGKHENEFKQIICHSDEKSNACNVEFTSFQIPANKSNQYSNARYRGNNNARGVISFLMQKNDSMYIVTLHRQDGYQVFDCNNDKWIVKNDQIKPSNHNAQAIMIDQSLV